MTPYRFKAAGLLTSATVFIYTAVVLFNALSSEPVGNACVRTAGNVSSGLQVRSAEHILSRGGVCFCIVIVLKCVYHSAGWRYSH